MKHIFTLFTILVATLNNYTCDCITYPVESYIGNIDYIFTGKVIALVENDEFTQFPDSPANRKFYADKSYTVQVLIIEKLKTERLRSDTLEFSSDFSNCDPIYVLGKSYLFFADKLKDNKFKMAHCTPWGEMKDSEENIEILRKN